MTEPAADSRPAIAAAIIVNDRRVLMVRRRISEGQLSWQFPAGEVEAGETSEQAAVRETLEEVGLTVTATKLLGERIHPNTGRTMTYVACDVVEGTAHVADDDELDAVEWCDRATLAQYVPYGLFGPVQDHIDAAVA
jgi:8-oxo-dGTP diphosphatase